MYVCNFIIFFVFSVIVIFGFINNPKIISLIISANIDAIFTAADAL